ncbi:hypothetical protein HYDPIDRAFT_104645 [Hydnomerulius pinastri MD-312]|nr:hypothetical protein HYDPIDRAFT_104645 [Hydnomerulius pinastri MD-312]
MLGARTKQVFAYGRRGHRIVNISDRRERDQTNDDSDASSSDEVALARRPPALKRENAIVISPAKPRVQRKAKRPSGSPAKSPLAPLKKNIRTKSASHTAPGRKLSKLEPSTPTRQPLSHLHLNGTSPNVRPSAQAKRKSKAPAVKAIPRAILTPRSPLVAVDIIVLDEDGSTVSQERRLSHTEVQTNPARTAPVKGKGTAKKSLKGTEPIVISDESDVEELPPKPATKRSRRRSIIVISSDESEAASKPAAPQPKPVPVAKLLPKTKSLRVEVVIPPAPFRTSKSVTRLPSTPPSPPPIRARAPPKTPPLQAPSFRLAPAAVPSLIPPPLHLAKARQLTPIRGGSSRSLFPRPPQTPSTPTDADLSLELAQLDLSDVTEIDDPSFAQPEYLVPLLSECSQACPHEFSAFIETFPFDPVVQSSDEDDDTRFRKIGEASYSEVFGIGDVVLKIIPIRNEEATIHQDADDIPAPSDAKDVLKEIIVTREIGEICNGFVKLLKTYVVRGRYPSLLLDLWDEYNERKGSESIRPDSFSLNQVYAIIVLPNGGPDLESVTFKNAAKAGWHQACSVFWQVARALEQAEELVNFEHRDLHWGQILVKSVPVKKSTSRRNSTVRVPMDDTRFGVKATIIDLGLSRMDATDGQGSKTYWTPFEDEIFEGEGDYQYDVYRMMRDLNDGSWKAYQPFTNVMWLHYLATKLLHSKRLKPPGARRKTATEVQPVSPTGYNEQDCHDCLVEVEKLLSNCISSRRKGQKGRRKTVAPPTGPKSAGEVVDYGVRKGWMR